MNFNKNNPKKNNTNTNKNGVKIMKEKNYNNKKQNIIENNKKILISRNKHNSLDFNSLNSFLSVNSNYLNLRKNYLNKNINPINLLASTNNSNIPEAHKTTFYINNYNKYKNQKINNFSYSNKTGNSNSNIILLNDKLKKNNVALRSNKNKKFESDIKINKIDRYLLKIVERIKKGDEKEKIKDDIIKEFKSDKSVTTNILQKLLNEQVTLLNNKIQEFKSKEYYTKEEINQHNLEIDELQRKINIIYQRSNYHINSIMEELCELLEKMDDIFNL
jgi:hypothetical protein